MRLACFAGTCQILVWANLVDSKHKAIHCCKPITRPPVPSVLNYSARIPLIRFVVDLLCSLLYNKSTTNRVSGVWALRRPVRGNNFTDIVQTVECGRRMAATLSGHSRRRPRTAASFRRGGPPAANTENEDRRSVAESPRWWRSAEEDVVLRPCRSAATNRRHPSSWGDSAREAGSPATRQPAASARQLSSTRKVPVLRTRRDGSGTTAGQHPALDGVPTWVERRSGRLPPWSSEHALTTQEDSDECRRMQLQRRRVPRRHTAASTCRRSVSVCRRVFPPAAPPASLSPQSNRFVRPSINGINGMPELVRRIFFGNYARRFLFVANYIWIFIRQELTDNHTHRRTHTRNKHNKNSRKREKKDQYSDLKIGLKWSRSISLSINLCFSSEESASNSVVPVVHWSEKVSGWQRYFSPAVFKFWRTCI